MTLPEYLTAHLGKPFAWGENDCVLFVGRWIALATGVDHLAVLPKWETEMQALRIIKKLGGLEKAMDDRFKRIDPNFAKDGDVALAGDRLCLFSGAQLVGPGEGGLVHVKRTEALCAWSY
jgi:hypothetical protein